MIFSLQIINILNKDIADLKKTVESVNRSISSRLRLINYGKN